jgi:hypothetical protein
LELLRFEVEEELEETKLVLLLLAEEEEGIFEGKREAEVKGLEEEEERTELLL